MCVMMIWRQVESRPEMFRFFPFLCSSTCPEVGVFVGTGEPGLGRLLLLQRTETNELALFEFRRRPA